MCVVIDYETRSRINLKACGGSVYTADDSTELLSCAALDLRQEPAIFYVWSPFPGPLTNWKLKDAWLLEVGIQPHEIAYAEPLLGTDDVPEKILEAAREGVPFIAHNAKFDSGVWNGCGLPPTEWIDTVSLCRRRGLPGDLERVGQALFGLGKDRTGQNVMKRCWAPMNRGKRKGQFLDPDGPRLSAIIRYGLRDVLLTAAAVLAEDLDAPHVDDPVLAAHEAIDARGVAVDLPLARLLLAVDAASAAAEVAACPVEGEVLRSPVQLLRWLKKQGVDLPDVQAPTIRAALERLEA